MFNIGSGIIIPITEQDQEESIQSCGDLSMKTQAKLLYQKRHAKILAKEQEILNDKRVKDEEIAKLK